MTFKYLCYNFSLIIRFVFRQAEVPKMKWFHCFTKDFHKTSEVRQMIPKQEKV